MAREFSPLEAPAFVVHTPAERLVARAPNRGERPHTGGSQFNYRCFQKPIAVFPGVVGGFLERSESLERMEMDSVYTLIAPVV